MNVNVLNGTEKPDESMKNLTKLDYFFKSSFFAIDECRRGNFFFK